MLYEIKMSTTDSVEDLYFRESWQSVVKLNEDIEVKFYQNPSIDMSDRRGLISSMTFKRI